MMIITAVQKNERDVLLRLAVDTGLFTNEDAEGLLGGVLDGLDSGELPDSHVAIVCRESADGPAIGWSYFAPDVYADKVLNVWWIGVDPRHHGSAAGKALLSHIEDDAKRQGIRVIVIETSDQALLGRARGFYVKHGYSERGRIPDFYGPGDAKVIFSRSLAGSR